MPIFAKKSLGQNFLTSMDVVRDIVSAGEVISSDTVLEIGPGKGMLTKALLETGAHVVAIEKDDRMIPLLEQTFANEITKGQFRLIHGDVLEMNTESIGIAPKSYKLIANIPYYITGEIIRMFFEINPQPSRIVLMVQKEVADRIMAYDDKSSILSTSIRAYGTPKRVRIVSKGCFSPAPTVDSAVLLIENISKDTFLKNKLTETEFFNVVKTGFAHKRKILTSNLSLVFSKEKISHIWPKTNLDPKVRAEDLSLDDWIRISALLFHS